jgi:DNA-directed RNA polymerase specialized sigma24 family protein
MASEELVVLAQECGYRPAADVLLLRYYLPMSQLIARTARKTSLTEPDIQDAQQRAVFALLEAIAEYDTLEMVKRGGCRFRSFAGVVTLRRFWDFVKHVCRVRKRYGGALSARDDALTPDAFKSGARPALCLWSPCDPAEAAARKEMLNKLEEALQRCPEEMRCLWEDLAAGKTLRQISQERDLPYDTLKRQRRKLLAGLAAACTPRANSPCA